MVDSSTTLRSKPFERPSYSQPSSSSPRPENDQVQAWAYSRSSYKSHSPSVSNVIPIELLVVSLSSKRRNVEGYSGISSCCESSLFLNPALLRRAHAASSSPFCRCILSSASLSRTWAVFDLNNVDTRLPLDCHDHEILDEATAQAGIEKRRTKFEETPMTSLIVKMKLAVLARKMVSSIALFP